MCSLFTTIFFEQPRHSERVFRVECFPLHFCRMLDTITKHYRPYLEGGVVLFLLPSSLHTVPNVTPWLAILPTLVRVVYATFVMHKTTVYKQKYAA